MFLATYLSSDWHVFWHASLVMRIMAPVSYAFPLLLVAFLSLQVVFL